MEQFYAEEQAYKLISNSIYGGLSHVANAFFNIHLANDITGEGRNLIHIMERHIPQFFQDNWLKMTDLHKKLGIQIKKKEVYELKYCVSPYIIYIETQQQ